MVLLLKQNYPFSKRKHGEKKLFCRQLNRSRRLFSFPGCDWLRFFQSWRVLYKRTSAQVPTASSLEHLERFFQRSGGYLLRKCTILYGKKHFHASLNVGKKHGLLIYLSKFSKIMRRYLFFRNYANYALRAELCDFASAHNSGSPLLTIRNKVLLKCLFTGDPQAKNCHGFKLKRKPWGSSLTFSCRTINTFKWTNNHCHS